MKPEESIQITVADFCRLHKIPFMHLANERMCHVSFAIKLKRMGVVAGASDCFLPRGNGQFKGLWIELKAGGNRPTKNQKNFIENIGKEGYYATWCQGADAAIQVIKDFYLL